MRGFVLHVFKHHGPPKDIIFDHDLEPTNKFLACFVEKVEDSKLIHIFYPKIMGN
jgi:hypothetical protein